MKNFIILPNFDLTRFIATYISGNWFDIFFIFITPIYYLIREQKNNIYWKNKTVLMTLIIGFFLIIAYLLARILLAIFSGMIISEKNYLFTDYKAARAIFYGSDFLFWYLVNRFKPLKEEPILWRMVFFFLFECFYIVLSVVLAYFVFTYIVELIN